MNVDQTIAEMLAYAIQNSYTGENNIKQFQRPWDNDADSILTLYLKGNLGFVSLTTKREVSKEITDRIIVPLAPLSCLHPSVERTEKYFIYRFRFNNPIYKRPIFPSELDKCLPQEVSQLRNTPAEFKQEEELDVKLPHKFELPPVPYDLLFPKLEDVPDEPYWQKLPRDRCHICHRELSDSISIRVSIGSVCRKHIEEREEQGPEMWDNISRKELERIWTEHNIHERKRAVKNKANR